MRSWQRSVNFSKWALFQMLVHKCSNQMPCRQFSHDGGRGKEGNVFNEVRLEKAYAVKL